MTDQYFDTYGIDRRTVLKSAAVLGAVGAFGLPVASGRVGASSHETLYLTDSGGDNGGSFLTKLYSVSLDDSGSSPRANLSLLLDLTHSDFGQVDAIAASVDGETIYMVDKTSRHLGTYDVANETFTDDGVISGLPGGVVLATYSPGGTLYVASQNDNTIYTLDPSSPSATEYVTVSGADVQGADIAFDSAGTLYLYSSGSQNLYTVDYDSSSSTFGDATLVGETGDFFTGLAVRDDGAGDLVGSNTTRDEIVVVDKTTGSQGTAYEMYLDDSRYAYGYGDMTVGALEAEETCVECTSDDLLAKYEFQCVEWDEDEECIGWDFVLEGTGDEGILYTEGSFESKDGEDFEPMSVTFDTDYCDLYVLVKSGQEFEVQAFEEIDESLTVDTANDEKYAISFVAFYCTEEAAIAASDAFPSKGKGGGKSNGESQGNKGK